MDEEPSPKPKRGCGWMQWLVALGILGLFLWASFPSRGKGLDKANQTATLGNCRQIVAALRIYAEDHDGEYPDANASRPSTSNDAFRFLISERVLDDERIFGAKSTKYTPDNNIGEPPEYKEALEAGENHWAMTKGVTSKSPPKTPLVFENPVTSGWPPMWNPDAAGKKEKGRTWRGGKIVVGFNDGSVEVMRLESARGSAVGLKPDADGKNVFTRAGDRMEMLDILE